MKHHVRCVGVGTASPRWAGLAVFSCAAGLLATASLLVTACTPRGDEGVRLGADEVETTELPRTEVKLPPPPSFQKEHPPARYTDGALSIEGLRADLARKLGQTVTVRGVVTEIYECPACPKGTRCRPCDKPYFWLADTKDGARDHSLMVTDYTDQPKATRRLAPLKSGQAYLITGSFAKESPSGSLAADGLLIYQSHEPLAEGTP
ncbi:MAG: hypothetical protein IPG96_11775 [Proteobacteria bacterium]|nr:hypothetical protein [Pseudomonadota bacterium]